MNDYGKDNNDIQAQTMIEMKTKKLTIPIRALGTVSLVMFLVIVGIWVYRTLMNPPSM